MDLRSRWLGRPGADDGPDADPRAGALAVAADAATVGKGGVRFSPGAGDARNARDDCPGYRATAHRCRLRATFAAGAKAGPRKSREGMLTPPRRGDTEKTRRITAPA